MQKEVYEFISKKNNDPIVEWRTCVRTGQEFAIFQSDIGMLHALRPVVVGEKIDLPLPTLCPEARQQRRMLFDNLYYLYKRKCDFTGETVVSRYSQDKPLKVYKQQVWRSDQRDPMDYGRDYDFSRPFFEQFKELYYDVPHYSVTNNFTMDENAEYTNYAGNNKNCYLIFGADYNENCAYNVLIKGCTYCFNNYAIYDSQHCFHSSDIVSCYKTFYSKNCIKCHESYFLENCQQCTHCVGCKNLVNQQYCIFNEQQTKEAYEAFVAQRFDGSWQKIQQFTEKFHVFADQHPNRATTTYETEKSVGNYLKNTKNVQFCYDVQNMEDARYCYQTNSGDNKMCLDMNTFGLGTQRVYESGSIGYNAYNIYFCDQVNENVSDIFYSTDIFTSKHLFGCAGLRDKEYCILNKQYTKEAYEALLPKIITHMQSTGERGQFFPKDFSPFAYNETYTIDYFPLSKEQALSQGFTWRNEVQPTKPDGLHIIGSDDLPDNIVTVTDDFLQKAIVGKSLGKPFKLMPMELKFYRMHNLPLPRYHPEVRINQRFAQRPERNLYLRTCDKTGKEMLSVYPSDTPFPVYSEEAYDQEVYS